MTDAGHRAGGSSYCYHGKKETFIGILLKTFDFLGYVQHALPSCDNFNYNENMEEVSMMSINNNNNNNNSYHNM